MPLWSPSRSCHSSQAHGQPCSGAQVLPTLDVDNLPNPSSTPPSASPTLSPFKLAARKRLSWANQGYNALPPAGSPGTPGTPVEGAPDSPGSHEGRPSDVEVGLDESIL